MLDIKIKKKNNKKNHRILDEDGLSDRVTYEDILLVINNFELELINSFTKNELLKNKLLKKKNVIYRNEEHKLSKEYYKNILKNIRNNTNNKEADIVMTEIATLINLFGYDRFKKDKINFKKYITTNIYSIVRQDCMFGDKHPTLKDKQSLAEKMLSWSKRFGNHLTANILNFETLKNRLEALLELDYTLYKDELLSLIELTEKAIVARDNETIRYNQETIEAINCIFDRYETINKEQIYNAVKGPNSEYELVHFVQSETVNYQLIGYDVIDVNESNDNINLENNFNKKQNSKFIDSYLEKVVKLIEKTLNTKFNLNNEEHRYLLEKYLDYYNKVFNNRPLDRLPINSFEVGRGYKRYVRPRNKRLSTSFIKKENIISHLDRKVGLVIEITSPDAIKTTSIGYTSESDYEIFEEDSVSLADLIYQTDEDGVNETCLDITKCAVKYVILVGDDPKNIKRAEDLAESYGVEIKSFESNKSLK